MAVSLSQCPWYIYGIWKHKHKQLKGYLRDKKDRYWCISVIMGQNWSRIWLWTDLINPIPVALAYQSSHWWLNTLRPRQNGRHFADDMFKCIILNENVWILIEISLKFVPKGSINNNPALFQIMAWRRPGDKPLSKPRMISLPTHICVTRPQWVNDPWYLTTGPGLPS